MDGFYNLLVSFEYSFVANNRFGKSFDDQLELLVNKFMNKELCDNTYLKLLQIYYYKYEFEKNVKGMRYCLLRMQQINSYKKNRRQRVRYPKIHFFAIYENSIRDFLLNQHSLYLDMIAQFVKEVLFVDTLLTILFMTVLVVLLKMNFYWSFILSLIIYFIIYFVCQYNLKESRVDVRCSNLSKKVDKQLVLLDVSLRR
ncbi:MAG: hypothetical protein Q4C49_10445 [Bacillota bacterium]|nr:hypothetical protein [Bacillota bacterium]